MSVVSYGELMLRVIPKSKASLQDSGEWIVTLGGAEANVLAGLAVLGVETQFISFLPNNPLGIKAYRGLKSFGVGTRGLKLVDRGRMGLYFVDFFESSMLTEVFYDRAWSAFAICEIIDEQVDLLKLANIFHFTGITPALSTICENNLNLLLDRLSSDVMVSFDVNYRGKLWEPEKCRSFLEKVMARVDLLFIKESDFQKVFESNLRGEEILFKLREIFGAYKTYVLTQGERGCMVFSKEGFASVPAFPVSGNVDRFGSGDAFVAGFLYAVLSGKKAEEAAIWGNAMAAIKLNVFGDMPAFEKRVVEELVNSKNLRSDVKR